MSLNVITKEILLEDGRKITIETGKLAKQAHGSAVVRMGNAMLLATVVSNYDAREGVDFLPLSVDYQEKFAANGRIPGGYLKREGRLSDNEVLVCRLVDRVLRPLFPSDYHAETQILISLISADKEVMPDALAALAASAALAVSDIPFDGPISEVRVGRVNGQFIVNPSPAQLAEADMDVMVGASAENIMMVEGEMKEASEAEMLEALKIAHDEIKRHCAAVKELEVAAGKTAKREYCHETHDEALRAKVNAELTGKIAELVKLRISDKRERTAAYAALKDAFLAQFTEADAVNKTLVGVYFHDLEKKVMRDIVLEEKIRLDGRKLDQIRNIWSETDYLPSAHGSAVFTRGETQSLTTVTLGTKLDEQMTDTVMGKSMNKFMLHYNFPAFSTGEARPNRGPGRREVGHGNLAFRALKGMIPSDYPYTVRIVSDILESNGSSSMATVCAGTLAMMDAGVNVKAPVSGIAMGLISDGDRYVVLSDILGDEDHLGDMDFKVTGTEKGITACQMDIKIDGLSYEILTSALEQARQGRLHILGEMNKTISAPRAELKDHTPRVEVLVIEKEMIGAVIGPGGKIIQEIQASTGATITIEEINGKGRVEIFGTSKDIISAAVGRVKGIVMTPEIGEVYEGKVKSIMPYGAFVEFLPGKDGLLHISEIKWSKVDKMEDVLEQGEIIKVKLIEVDQRTGKFKLSRKVLLPKPEVEETQG